MKFVYSKSTCLKSVYVLVRTFLVTVYQIYNKEMDERFKHIATDPKFRRAPRNKKNVKIDKRFQSMFHSKKFKGSAKVDMRGRPINHSVDKDLKKYYEINSDESDSDAEKQEDEDEEAELKVKHKTDKDIPKKIVRKLKDMDVDYARGEGDLYSDSSSDDEESDEEIEEIEHGWGELDADAGETDDVTHRLAACNMDWDRIRAVDLLVLMTSFLPPGGSIISVNIYPSEFGKQRMAEEDIKGPKELVSSNDNYEVDDDEENEEGSKYHMEKLRQYQLNRLKYYYAVITFDSDSSANKVYTECDGMEYESSATKMDLRFIPDDMTFDDPPKESCDKLPDSSRYEPRFFTTTALQQSKVDLTWDETNQDRKELTEKLAKGKIDDISEADLQNYLASSSGEESEEEQTEEKDNSGDGEESDAESNENPIDKYKALLADIEEKEKEKKNKDIGMEISWGIDVQEKTDQLIKKKKEENQDKTPFQEYLDKRNKKRKEKTKLKKQQNVEDDDSSEDNDDLPSDIDMNDPYFAEEFDKPEFKKKSKKKIEENEEEMDEQKQAELELLLLNEGDDEKKHFSLKKIQEQENDKKSKKKKKKGANAAEPADDFKVNVNDERFSALFTSHHYNIEPTNPHYKKTKAMETLINEKLKRRAGDEEEIEAKRPKVDNKKQSAELSVLVKSVKRKAQEFGKKKNK